MRKVVDHQERRIKLIEATWRTIVRDGWDAATMSAIGYQPSCSGPGQAVRRISCRVHLGRVKVAGQHWHVCFEGRLTGRLLRIKF